MTDIIVNVPRSQAARFYIPAVDPARARDWVTLRRKPTELKVGDFIWFQIDGVISARAKVHSFSSKAQVDRAGKRWAAGTHVIWRYLDYEELVMPLTKKRFAPSKGFAYMPPELKPVADRANVRRKDKHMEEKKDTDTGLIESKYIISKSSGVPIDPGAQYFVLRLDTDEDACAAARVYAHRARKRGKVKLASDLFLLVAAVETETRVQTRARRSEADRLALLMRFRLDPDAAIRDVQQPLTQLMTVSVDDHLWVAACDGHVLVTSRYKGRVDPQAMTDMPEIVRRVLEAPHISAAGRCPYGDLEGWAESAVWNDTSLCLDCEGEGCDECEGEGRQINSRTYRPGLIVLPDGKEVLVNRNLIAQALEAVPPADAAEIVHAKIDIPTAQRDLQQLNISTADWRVILMPLKDEPVKPQTADEYSRWRAQLPRLHVPKNEG